MKNNPIKIRCLCFIKLTVLTFSISYAQGELHQSNDTIYNSFNIEYSFERNMICNEDDNGLEIDTLLISDELLALYNGFCQENFLYDDNRKKLFSLGRFSGSMGIAPSEVSFIPIGNNEVGILYYSMYCKFGFCEEFYLFYLYHINEGFVVRLCYFTRISITEMGKEKNDAIYNDYKIDIESRKIIVNEYIPYKYKNKKYKTNTMECYW